MEVHKQQVEKDLVEDDKSFDNFDSEEEVDSD